MKLRLAPALMVIRTAHTCFARCQIHQFMAKPCELHPPPPPLWYNILDLDSLPKQVACSKRPECPRNIRKIAPLGKCRAIPRSWMHIMSAWPDCDDHAQRIRRIRKGIPAASLEGKWPADQKNFSGELTFNLVTWHTIQFSGTFKNLKPTARLDNSQHIVALCGKVW
jgi:hypothetical protein